ncbi:MAG: protocatechuate 3,4-dioxygenase subunit alpha [Acidobacteriota bacterium]|nr:protocatechuate 3,4-dioxygenase subunit alpha [Acidobacteriota bacterium]MDE3170497.1 protocatechuate 3,4-dioxygenase subunit alpha [Acidobacteriota bacterium]
MSGAREIPRIAAPGASGERVKLICTIFDRDGVRIDDAMIEIWQANADGKYNHSAGRQSKGVDAAVLGFGRVSSNSEGICVFETIKPGRVPGRDGGLQAPHLEVSVFARGVLKRLATRIYFAGEPANEEDPVLALVPKARRNTLMAEPVASSTGGEPGAWRFDVHLAGRRETVFFDV